MEALARQTGHRLFGPVHRVPQQGMADGGQVDPDLVGAAGLQPALDVGMAGITAQNGPVGHRRAAVGPVYGHLFPVHRVAADGGVYGAGLLPEGPHAYRLVLPVEGVVLELLRQGQVGGVVLGGDEEPRGVPVDAVDDARPQLPVDAERLSPQWKRRALTRVPSGWPGAGWTTMPTGLFTTMTSSSS